ncbi:hypothetical protein C1645_822497 [Glomus cerebriforme]|uniref:Uncharacterized protein n=1 Tax=Glomus cerebriforme TaxID=658196 RepID=A0A397T2I4_9GLOM|nr:hypothetical protein C1645_822497 [Glomus cerebriforme]
MEKGTFEDNPNRKLTNDFILFLRIMAASIPSKSSIEEVYECFEKLGAFNDQYWIQYYCQPYVLASLNKYISNMENEVWERYGNNTNAAEAAHAQANREGKQLKLLTAIMQSDFT